MIEKLVSVTPILVNCLVSIISIIIGALISKHTIDTNKKLNVENAKINAANAGKNRIIYGVEEIPARTYRPADYDPLNKKLSSGNYTILSVIQDSGNNSQRLFMLGKIKT